VIPDTSKLDVALRTIAGFGVGSVIVPSNTVAATACPDNLIGMTVALSLSISVIGASFGYTIYYNIFTNKLKTALPAYVAKAAVGAGLPALEVVEFITTLVGAPAKIMTVPGVTPSIVAAATRSSQDAYAYGLEYVWNKSIAFRCVSIIACFFFQAIAGSWRIASRLILRLDVPEDSDLGVSRLSVSVERHPL